MQNRPGIAALPVPAASTPRRRESWSLPLIARTVLPVAVAANGVLLARYFDVAGRGVDAVLFMLIPAIAAILILRQNPLDYGLRIGNWAKHRLRKEVMQFDPRVPSPEEQLGALPE